MIFRRRRRVTQQLYEFVLAQSRQPRFYGPGRTPDTVDGRFELLALHLTLAIRRLNAEDRDGRDAAQDLFDTFVRDMDANLRELGAADARFGKKMRNLVAAFYGRAKSYSEALDSGDDAPLRDALLRNLFDGAAAPEELDGLTAYCRAQAARLAATDFPRLFGETTPFAPPSMA